jgi:hypothetical protein
MRAVRESNRAADSRVKPHVQCNGDLDECNGDGARFGQVSCVE